jgi:hypothetical protein
MPHPDKSNEMLMLTLIPFRSARLPKTGWSSEEIRLCITGRSAAWK